MMRKFLGLMLVFVMMGVHTAQAKTKAGAYKIIQKISLPGDGGWDFLTVDSKARRIYLTHNNSVQVVDADTYKLIGTVENVPRAHGVVVVPKLGKGYATSGDPGSVVVFDLKTFKRLAEIKTYPDTDAILYDKKTGRVITFNGDSKNAAVINPVTDKLIKTVDLGAAPEVAVSDGQGTIFDNLESSSEIVKIDAKSMKILRHWSLAPGDSPSGLAMDVAHHRLFSGCRNKTLVVMNSNNGKVVQTLPIGEHVDGTCFDSASGNVFSSNGDGTLTVIHEDSPNHFTVVENVKTEPGARTLAFDSKTGHVFLPTAKTQEGSKNLNGTGKSRRKAVPGSFHLLVLGN